MTGCPFIRAWVGACGRPLKADSKWCDKHDGMKCWAHKRQATHDCENAGSLVCGAPLCDLVPGSFCLAHGGHVVEKQEDPVGIELKRTQTTETTMWFDVPASVDTIERLLTRFDRKHPIWIYENDGRCRFMQTKTEDVIE